MKLLPFTACLAALAIGGAANAQSVRVTETDDGSIAARVRYGDLDLSRQDGAHAMIDRLRLAASAVCGGPPADPFSLNGKDRFEACMSRTLDEAVARLDQPVVSAAYAGDARLASRDSAQPRRSAGS